MSKNSHLSALLFCFAFGIHSNLSAQQIDFQSYGYSQALQLAKEQNKMVLLTFKADWCKACKWMKTNVFNDPFIVETANRDFVNLRINYDTDNFWKHHYKVASLPSSVIIDSRGNLVASRR